MKFYFEIERSNWASWVHKKRYSYTRNVGSMPFFQSLVIREESVSLRDIATRPSELQSQFAYSVRVFNGGFGCPSIGKDIATLFQRDSVAAIAQNDLTGLQTVKNVWCLKNKIFMLQFAVNWTYWEFWSMPVPILTLQTFMAPTLCTTRPRCALPKLNLPMIKIANWAFRYYEVLSDMEPMWR